MNYILIDRTIQRIYKIYDKDKWKIKRGAAGWGEL